MLLLLLLLLLSKMIKEKVGLSQPLCMMNHAFLFYLLSGRQIERVFGLYNELRQPADE